MCLYIMIVSVGYYKQLNLKTNKEVVIMYQTKLFSGYFHEINGEMKSAEKEFNEWMEKHPDIEIVKYVYKHKKYGNHSIAILYKEDR